MPISESGGVQGPYISTQVQVPKARHPGSSRVVAGYMKKAMTRPMTPVRLGDKVERAPFKTGAVVAVVPAVVVKDEEVESEDACTPPTPEATMVNDDGNEEEDTRMPLGLVALSELVSLVVPAAPAASVAPAVAERADPAPTAPVVGYSTVLSSVEPKSSLSVMAELGELVEVFTRVSIDPAALAVVVELRRVDI